MSFTLRSGYLSFLAATFMAVALMATASMASDSNAQNVNLFAAMQSGQVDVKVIPKNATQVNVLVTNKTQEPLSVTLPKSLAAVPVLAAAAGAGGARRNAGGIGSSSSSSNQQQSLGGGVGGVGGALSIPPEEVGQFKATTVCLEYGKPEPRPQSNYTVVPLDSYTSNLEVQELCEQVGSNTLDQRVAQLAAWHLANGLTWEQLSQIEYRFANGGGAPQFSPQEIQAAMQLTAKVTADVQQKHPETSDSLGN